MAPPYTWVPASLGDVPENAVVGGKDIDGETLYVGRAKHEGETLPCKINPTHDAAYVAFAGKEHSKFHYEVLCCSDITWQPVSNGQVPKNAVVGGQTKNGEKLYIGRVFHSSSVTPGKVQVQTVHPNRAVGVLHIPFGGNEFKYYENYEIAMLL